MKKLLKLGNIIPLLTFFVISFLISCGSKSGGAGGGGPIVPPPTPGPSVTTSGPTSPIFYQVGATSIQYGASGSAVSSINVRKNGVVVKTLTTLSGYYPVDSLTSNTTYRFEAMDNKGNVLATSADVTVQVYSSEMTNLCYQAPGTTGIWRMTSLRYHGADGIWHDGGSPICEPTSFTVDGKCFRYNGQCVVGGITNQGVWSFVDLARTTINWNGTVYTVAFQSITKFTRTKVNASGQTVEETFEKE